MKQMCPFIISSYYINFINFNLTTYYINFINFNLTSYYINFINFNLTTSKGIRYCIIILK